MKRFVFLFIVFIMLVSCGTSKDNIPLTNEEFWTGTHGLEFSFVDENPPDTVYENMLFSIALEIANEGAHTLNGYMTLSIEDDYMCLVDEYNACSTFNAVDQYSLQLRNEIKELYNQIDIHTASLSAVSDPDEQQVLKDAIYNLRRQIESKKDASPISNEYKTRWFSLEGKSIFNHEGGSDVMEYKAKAKSTGSMSTEHDVQVIATACYEYTTVWNQEVCIDTDINKMNIFKGACEATDIGLSSQGAPLVITGIKSKMLPTGTGYIRPMFTIYVANRGNGKIINKDKTEHACTSTGLNSKDYNLVVLKSFILSNENLIYDFNGLDPKTYKEVNPESDGDTIHCYPNPLILKNDGDDHITCVVNEDIEQDMFSLNQAPYTATISLQLDYGYTLSKSVPITIERITG